MAFLVLGIGFLKYIMDLLSNVLNLFNELGFFFSLHVRMGRFNLYGCKGESYINGAQKLKCQANQNLVVDNKDMKRFVVAMFHIRKVFIPHVWMFGFVHL